jgi:hypothetical protein
MAINEKGIPKMIPKKEKADASTSARTTKQQHKSYSRTSELSRLNDQIGTILLAIHFQRVVGNRYARKKTLLD